MANYLFILNSGDLPAPGIGLAFAGGTEQACIVRTSIL